ncbi:MAG: ATPase AAA [Betaproteobacteria bacterium]|nr:MAG: ATPase AAA [Betaproteobacteria bacterium]
MIVYQQTKAGFLDDVFRHDIEDVILRTFRARTGHSVAKAEIHAWKDSLVAVAKVINDDAVPDDCGVAVEYGIPQTAKRIDFLLSGANASNGQELVIVELKQWERAESTRKDAIVRTRFAHGVAEVSHPSYQAWSYSTLLADFNETVQAESVQLRPCAYLHNFHDDGSLTAPFYREHLQRAPVFLRGEEERRRLRDFISQHVRAGDRNKLLNRIDRGRIRPSKGLVDCLANMLKGKAEFVLIDDQKVAYETMLDLARSASPAAKQVVIVEGGPGTGKSVVAINAMVALTQSRHVAKYVTRNAAPRAVFEAKLSGHVKKSRISNLFGGTGSFVETNANVFDALVVDEAHRVNERSGLYGNLGTHQVDEIIGSSKCAIFFIDEDQRVTWNDVGTKADIERRARQAGAHVTHLRLESQFRCNGSDGYLAWLDNTLGIRETANQTFDGIEFDFRVFDTPGELLSAIKEKNNGKTRARMVAGYCWDWRSKKAPEAMDVVIPEHSFQMQWNLDHDGSLWIIVPGSVEQIGCIHTCQGLEVDWIGVIVGPDLVIRNGILACVPEKRSKHDRSIKGYKKLLKSDPAAARRKADSIIRNTYRTLMTRGMKGCYVFCTDPATNAYFKSRIVS